jgi:hypothetical protein
VEELEILEEMQVLVEQVEAEMVEVKIQTQHATAGTANTGGGGGGSGNNGAATTTSANGGSGVVILRMPTAIIQVQHQEVQLLQQMEVIQF